MHATDVMPTNASSSADAQSGDGEADTTGHREASARPGAATGGVIAGSEPARDAAAVTRAVLVNAAIDLARGDGSPNTALSSGATEAASAGMLRAVGGLTPALTPAAVEGANADGRVVAADPFASPVVRGLQTMVHHRGGVMTMRLDPPELGALRVQVSIVGGSVSARFDAQSLAAQQLLHRHMPTLRSALESQGLNVERLTVTGPAAPGMSEASHRSGGDPARSDDGRSPRHDASQGESRGRRDQRQPSADNHQPSARNQ